MTAVAVHAKTNAWGSGAPTVESMAVSFSSMSGTGYPAGVQSKAKGG